MLDARGKVSVWEMLGELTFTGLMGAMYGIR